MRFCCESGNKYVHRGAIRGTKLMHHNINTWATGNLVYIPATPLQKFSAEEEPGYEASEWPLDVHVKHEDTIALLQQIMFRCS